MTVTLTSPVEGKQPGDTYTGPNEAYLLASGYAKQAGYTGPGVANIGPADTTIANNREFDATRGPIAKDSALPFGGTNDGVELGPADAPTVTYTGADGPSPAKTDGVFEGFANDPDARVDTLTRQSGSGALPTAGGTVVRVKGYGFADAAGATVGGTNATAFSVISPYEVQFTVPAKAAGSYTVAVLRPQGNVSKTNLATYA